MLTAAAALKFCSTSTDAVMLTVWPSGTGLLSEVEQWLHGANAKILYDAPVPLTTESAELLTVMALYDGEEWLESNCWYMEQPLPTGPPTGPFAGAKWKRALCYRNDADHRPHAYVCDVSACGGSLWSSKYGIRRTLANKSGNPGNSCIHLTDEQTSQVLAGQRGGGGGMACDASYAYACAKALLHPASVSYLNEASADDATLASPAFRRSWQHYTSWLSEPLSGEQEDDDEGFPKAPAAGFV